MMTNEEVALGLSQKYGAPKNKNREIAVYQSCIEMAEWKNSQFKEYLEKKKEELFNTNCLSVEPYIDFIDRIINELFGGE